ncbi:hypothetical protein [Aureliella helgolandensis]|uniref:Uncharacterized protein n=1 Tax=Aureliella helgolandensis TaxID=2527968 RepID=A0A518GFS7_9BACT|nr:hypothetical protein [Aureliella helgolandensis]QDV27456.1 hypothetical protein Q31a_58450 [Aureliella helgolandensis]
MENSPPVMKANRSHMSPAGESSRGDLAGQCGDECADQREDFQQLLDDVGDSVVHYCRRRPGVAAFSLFAVGFFFGWKIKPW